MFIIIELLFICGILWLIINLFHYFIGLTDNNPLFALSNKWRTLDKKENKK